MYKGKKLLILGGAIQHLKLVNAAKRLGIYTIVTDYLDNSPCKKICDESWMYDVNDIDSIVEKCKLVNIDGVISCWLDICQIPYSKICEKLGLPCYGTADQFLKMTNKRLFKALCQQCGLSVIKDYTEDDIMNDNVNYPIYIKPVDSRGSRGQSICINKEEAIDAIKYAKSESSEEDVVIEQYLSDQNCFQVTCFVSNGLPYILRTADGYGASKGDELEKVAVCSISPSVYSEKFIELESSKIERLVKALGYQDGPLMIQGFYDNGVFRYFDPGLRLPGVEYDIVLEKKCGINLMESLVYFAINGKFPPMALDNESKLIGTRKVAILFPIISEGEISLIKGLDDLQNDDDVYSVQFRHIVGDKVDATNTVNQRLAEILIVCNDIVHLKLKIKNILSAISVKNMHNKEMVIFPFDSDRILSNI